MLEPLRIWIVDDDPTLRRDVLDLLHAELPFQPEFLGTAASIEQADALFETECASGVINRVLFALVDVQLPDGSGLDLLERWKQKIPSLPVYLFTTHGTIKNAVQGMRLGAADYLEKPLTPLALKAVVDRTLEERSLMREVAIEAPAEQAPLPFLTASESSRHIEDLVLRVGQVPSNVLIQGENGTGKELVARAIHLRSPRRDGPFVAVNCGAIPDGLIESELFGHEKGAFTGADSRRVGLFQSAHGGTLFLDEIGDISPALQVKLLRVLQERTFNPLGSRREIEVDVRIIAATHQNLEEAVAQGKFRQDLFFRLCVLPIRLPPLRDRRDEIPHLTQHFISKLNQKYGWNGTERQKQGITDTALERLTNYPWPGNIRELENVLEHLFVFSDGPLLEQEALPERLLQEEESPAAPPSESTGPSSYHAELNRFEREFIVEALKRHQGRINQTATLEGIPKNTLLRKIRKYGILPQEVGQ